MSEIARTFDPLESLKNWALAVYILSIVSYFVGITGLVALIIAYVKRPDARGTFVESHFTWNIRTFWYSLLWLLVIVGVGLASLGASRAGLSVAALLGALGLLGWVIYRIVRGLVYLSQNKPLPVNISPHRDLEDWQSSGRRV